MYHDNPSIVAYLYDEDKKKVSVRFILANDEWHLLDVVHKLC